jgi:transposase-like protein
MAAGEQNRNDESPSGPASGDQGGAPEKSPGPPKRRPIPPKHEHVQANFCKTPGCANFGVFPREGVSGQGRGKAEDDYKITGSGPAKLLCKKCGVSTRMKSNLAIYEEWERQATHRQTPGGMVCPNDACTNHEPSGLPVEDRFRRYGKTHSGSDRWQCRACKKTFSIGKATRYQQKPHKNALAFDLLVNKVPISRMVEILDLTYASVYGKIDFIYRQCKAFEAEREAHMPSLHIPRLYLSTDRQDYLVNWGDRSARKTIQLTAVATADLASGYVFGLVPNFDPAVLPEYLEKRWLGHGDRHKPPALRATARLWTLADYAASAGLPDTREDVASRDDLDAPELLSLGQQLPTKGTQVHADYLIHGHYWVLRDLLRNVEKVRFSVDQEQGLLGGCLGAFADRVAARTADVVVVDIAKNITNDDRKSRHAKARKWFEQEVGRFPGMSIKKARTAILQERIAAARACSDLPDRHLQPVWIDFPFPDMAEPGKRLRYVTDMSDYDDHHVANLLMKATLWPIDTVFNRIRRRIALFERPVQSVRRARRMWHIYAPYDPMMVEKMLTIYRVWHNFVWINKKSGRTAAEIIGLAHGKVRPQDILYFK